MKFYVLWSNNIVNLHRNMSVLPTKDTVVVINTRDELQRDFGVDYCEDKGIEHYVTESDGTPSTGKNSVLKLFLESNEEYMVQIDGDDFLTPYGVKLYKELAKHSDAPDMVVLYRQPSVRGGHPWQFDLDHLNGKPYYETRSVEFPFDKSTFTLEKDMLVDLFTNGPQYKLPLTKAIQWADDRLEFDDFMYKKMEDKEFMCRMVFHSRKVAELMHYEKNLIVGEDTHQFLKLKKLALKGELNILRRMERRLPTYIYDQGNKQSVMRTEFENDWSWCRTLLNELYKLEDLPDNASLNEFRDEEFGIKP